MFDSYLIFSKHIMYGFLLDPLDGNIFKVQTNLTLICKARET